MKRKRRVEGEPCEPDFKKCIHLFADCMVAFSIFRQISDAPEEDPLTGTICVL